MSQQRVFTADLGSTKVAVLSAVLNESGQVKVDGVAFQPCYGVVKGEIAHREEVETALQAALERVQDDVKAKAKGLYTSIGGTHVHSMRAQGFMPVHPAGRVIKRQDVHQVFVHSRQFLLPPGREQILAEPIEFKVDQQRGIHDPIGLTASRLEVLTHIATVDTATVNKAEVLVHGLGLELLGAVPEALASALGVVTKEGANGGTVVVDVGGTITNLAVLRDRRVLHLAGFPIGSRHVTSDLSQLLKLELRDAERLKVEHGQAVAATVNDKELVCIRVEGEAEKLLPKRVVCEIIESRIRELVGFVRDSVAEAGLGEIPPGGVVLTGGGSLLSGIDHLFAEGLGVSRVKVVEPRAAGGHSREIGSPAMATSVGLARYALESSDDDYATASGQTGWSQAVTTLKSLFGPRP